MGTKPGQCGLRGNGFIELLSEIHSKKFNDIYYFKFYKQYMFMADNEKSIKA